MNTARAKTVGWGWVLVAGLFEVGMTYALKMEQQEARYLGLFLLCAVVSFECLAQSLKTLPIGLAYAVWTGIGSVGTIVLGIMLFGEAVSPVRLALLTILIAALLGLKLIDSSPRHSGSASVKPPEH